MKVGYHDRALVAAEMLVGLRMPDVEAIRDRIKEQQPARCWLFVDPGKGTPHVLAEGSERQISLAKSHLSWLLGIYGGPNSFPPDLGDLAGDISHHLGAISA